VLESYLLFVVHHLCVLLYRLDYVLPDTSNNDGLFFAESSKLTHIRITLCHFEHCVHLLNQLGPQLHSFYVWIANVCPRDVGILSEIISVS
jgi:hypothetical protein